MNDYEPDGFAEATNGRSENDDDELDSLPCQSSIKKEETRSRRAMMSELDSLLWRSSSKKGRKVGARDGKNERLRCEPLCRSGSTAKNIKQKSMNDDKLDSFAKTLQQKTDDGRRE
jgi:hypothetical protein